MSGSFEAHITIDKKYASKVRDVVAFQSCWKFSEIDGDPVLGDGLKCYLTAHSDDGPGLYESMSLMVTELMANDVPCLRRKIELIVFDTANQTNRLNELPK